MTQLKRHVRVPVLSAVCLVAVAAFAAAAGGDDKTGAISGERAEQHAIRADNRQSIAAGYGIAGHGGAAFNLTDYYRWRDNVASPLQADDADAARGESASAAVNSFNSADSVNHRRARGDDGNFGGDSNLRGALDLQGLAAGVVNHGGGSIAEWRKQTQMRLFAALEDELARRGEEAMLFNFTSLKKAQIQVKTELGGRKGHIGASFVGSIAEEHNSALGWQLRAYGGQESSKGFNTGVFYRRINGEALLGGNLFVDYEDQRHGRFIRYSVGGDLQYRFVHLAGNYYVPITGEKRTDARDYVKSRKGYDIQTRIVVPQTRYVRVALDHYHFEDFRRKKAQKGFRYGAEVHHFPLRGLRFGLFRDNEGKQLGSEFAYTHTFGEEQEAAPISSETPPLDLFAPVDREHSQRIVVSQPPIPPVQANVIFGGSGTAMVPADFPTWYPIATILATNGGSSNYHWELRRPPGIFFDLRVLGNISNPAGGRELLFRRVNAGMLTATVVIGDGPVPITPSVTLFFTAIATTGMSDASDFLITDNPAVEVLAQGDGLHPAKLPHPNVADIADIDIAAAAAGYDDNENGGSIRQMPPIADIRYRPKVATG